MLKETTGYVLKAISYQILISDSEQVTELHEIFFNHGAISVSVEDASAGTVDFCETENSLLFWNRCWVKGVFDEDHFSLTALRAELTEKLGTLPEEVCEGIPDRDWVAHWQLQTQPIAIGKNLLISPTHCLSEAPQAIQIQLDPGMAFGTGQHATTRLCLEWLEQYNCHGKTFLDFGCGSGILAIAAAKLGAQKVWAVDIDPKAIEVTLENRNKNHIPEETLVAGLPEQMLLPKVDVIIANIYLNELIKLQPILTEKLHSGGKLLLTGILLSQKDLILNQYSPYFDFSTILKHNEWILCIGKKV